MYNIIRIIIGCIFLVCSIAVIKKSKTIRKRIFYAIFSGISIVLITVLTFLPFENLFITFNSPKSAYEYYNFGKSNIELVVEGNNCDFIIDRQNYSDTHLIIPKSADGWKIGIGLYTKRIVKNFSNGITIYVYQYKNTSDYFITILNTSGGESTVSDEYNTKFYSLERYDNSLDKTFVTYYGHLTNFNTEYSVMVNDNNINIR
jgi:hypothetical protein